MCNIKGTQLYGWYSQAAADRWGYDVYSTADGREVCVTLICTNRAYGEQYKWSDKQEIGAIENRLRSFDGSESESERESERFLFTNDDDYDYPDDDSEISFNK